MKNSKDLKISYNKKNGTTNFIFLLILHAIAIVGTVILLMVQAIPWQTWMLALFFYLATGFAITAGYHRLFTHKSYQTTWLIRLILLMLGAAALQNSALIWSSQHRYHHQFSDTELDPYNINKGFYYAHIGWIFTGMTYPLTNVKDLQRDPLIRWQDKFYIPIAIFISFILPTVIASFWGDPWGGLIIAGFLRLIFSFQITLCINSVAHLWGWRPYGKTTQARDNVWLALLTLGEGYHNYHHEVPYDYRNGPRLFNIDPTKWLIKTLALLGMASNLKIKKVETNAHQVDSLSLR